jgi:hypothetical protein
MQIPPADAPDPVRFNKVPIVFEVSEIEVAVTVMFATPAFGAL